MDKVPPNLPPNYHLNLNNPPKFYVVVLTLICLTALMLTNTIEAESGLALIALIVGYGIGNGIAAVNNERVEPMIGAKDQGEPK